MEHTQTQDVHDVPSRRELSRSLPLPDAALSGVALAAIQGLHEVVRERDAEIEELRRSRDELAARIEALELLAAKVVP